MSSLPPDMKLCRKCDKVLPKSAFYAHGKAADGLQEKCKECARAAASKNYRANRDYYKKYEHDRFQRVERKAAALEYQRRRREAHPEKNAARNAVSNALRDGIIVKGACSVCGSVVNIEAHHSDYAAPLEVTWLCRKHHLELHNKEAY